MGWIRDSLFIFSCYAVMDLKEHRNIGTYAAEGGGQHCVLKILKILGLKIKGTVAAAGGQKKQRNRYMYRRRRPKNSKEQEPLQAPQKFKPNAGVQKKGTGTAAGGPKILKNMRCRKGPKEQYRRRRAKNQRNRRRRKGINQRNRIS